MANQVTTAADGKVSVVDSTGKVIYSYYPGGTSGSTTPTNTNPVLTQGSNYYDTNTGKNIGTVEYDANTGAKLTKGATTQLQPVTAPTNAGAISPSGATNLPQLSPYYGNISGATALSAGAQSYFDTQSQILLDRQKMEETLRNQIAKTESGKAEKSFLQKFLSTESPEEVRDDAWDRTGIDPKEYFADQKAKVAEINSLTQEYNAVKAARDQAIATSFDKLASNSFINNQQAQIERNAAPKLNELSANINAKAALLQALQGNFREAQNFVNQAVEDAMASRKFNYENYQALKSENEELFSRLSKPYQDAYNLKLDLVEQDYRQTLADKKTIGQLMIENPNAGIDIYNDTLEEALEKVASISGVTSTTSRSSGGTSTASTTNTTSGYKFTSTQLNKGASNSGLSLQEFKTLPGDVQNFYINTSATNLQAINEVLSGDPEEAIELINSSNMTEEVKQYFLSKVQVSEKTSTPLLANPFEGGFFNNLWGGIKNLFN